MANATPAATTGVANATTATTTSHLRSAEERLHSDSPQASVEISAESHGGSPHAPQGDTLNFSCALGATYRLQKADAGGIGDLETDVAPGRSRPGAGRQLAAALEAAASGTGSLVVIAGAAGTGKSALLAVVAERARALGVGVRSGRGSELEQELSFGVIRQLFEVPVRSLPPAERERLLSGAAAAAAGLFEDAPLDHGARGDGGFATQHGLYWVATAIAAERPLLIAVDDAHWVDEPTLRGAQLPRGPDRRRPDRARRHDPHSRTEPSGRGLDEPRV